VPPSRATPPGDRARQVAREVLVRIERDDAYANLALGPALARSGLDRRDRGLVTELVYGVTRMRRSCDWLVDRFVTRGPDLATRTALRLGAYQLTYSEVPAHAAVSSAVAVAPSRTRGFVNAVLRRVADAGPPAPEQWPSDAVRLSYPDWIVEWAREELGDEAGLAVLAHQNEAPAVTAREDGYVQDRASQMVTALVGAVPGELVLDLCAAPGGKATGLAAAGARVVALELSETRAGLVASNAVGATMGPGPPRPGGEGAPLGAPGAAQDPAASGAVSAGEAVSPGEVVSAGEAVSAGGTGPAGDVWPVVGDGRRPPVVSDRFGRVLVDAPCSGLGVLRRRPDARWRIGAGDVVRLATLQRRLIEGALEALAPGGVLVYSVCTLTSAETVLIDEWLASAHPELEALPAVGPPWEPAGRGARLLPHRTDTDGMYVLRLRRPVAAASRPTPPASCPQES
jgi:16S rRNA (cytosine967-C5)-methyltransferase